MEMRKILGKKSLKLLMLLLTSLLIASVSASVYYNMFMNSTVGVSGNKVQFWAGADFTTVGGSITDARQKVTFSSMNGQNGSITTITDPVKINNTDSGSQHVIELKLSSWTGNSLTVLYYINVTMYDATDTKKGNSIYLVPGGSGQVNTTGNQTIAASGVWRAQWGIYWRGNATASNSVNVNLLLVVWS